MMILFSIVGAQPTYEFEIMSLPYMETPLRMNSMGTEIVGTNFGRQAVYWSDSTGTIVHGTGELWGISDNGRIFSELANSDDHWEAALIDNGNVNFL